MTSPALIIGASPAGLAAAATLRRATVPFEIVEQSGREIGLEARRIVAWIVARQRARAAVAT